MIDGYPHFPVYKPLQDETKHYKVDDATFQLFINISYILCKGNREKTVLISLHYEFIYFRG